jgi:SpoVK/Ycf46/Vps4 family AAA+-type ATPase
VSISPGKDYDGDVYVDTASTKMLQSFYASTLIPLRSVTLQSYLGIPHLPLPDEEAWKRIKGLSRLTVLAEATVSSFGREANLSLLSVLVHGQRGVGKKTVAEWVATSLGLHFFEVVLVR